MAGATGKRYEKFGFILLTTKTRPIKSKAKKNALMWKYVMGESVKAAVANITIPVKTGYSTAFASLV